MKTRICSKLRTGIALLLLLTLGLLQGCVVAFEPARPRYYYSRGGYYREGGGAYVEQGPTYYYGPPPATVVVTPTASPTADPALEQLVAPIALYPDALIADILPAATFPDQVIQANQFVQTYPTASPADIDAQNWAPAVKAVAHYPTVIRFMADQPDWTRSLGSAFLDNQADVLAAIQDLRADALARGNLTSTAYMDVVVDGPTISIQPADPNVMYVPAYDPVLVYEQPYAVVYGPEYPVGPWLDEGIDWDGDVIFIGDWHGGWGYRDGHWYRDHSFVAVHFWVRDDHWGPRPFVDRGHWEDRPEMQAHGGFRPIARTPQRAAAIQNHNAAVRNQAPRQGVGERETGPGGGGGDRPADKGVR